MLVFNYGEQVQRLKKVLKLEFDDCGAAIDSALSLLELIRN